MKRNSIFRRKSEMFMTALKQDDLENVQERFIAGCEEKDLKIPKGISHEFNNRIGRTSKGPNKAKLNFRKCGLNDDHVIILMGALAVSPVLTKLDLQENEITSKGADYVFRLLKGQTRLIRSVPVEKRLTATFLGKVEISSSSSIIDPKILQDIKTYAEALAFANAQTFIHNVYIKHHAPDVINSAFVVATFHDILNRSAKNDHEIDNLFLFHRKMRQRDNLSFPEYESTFLNALLKESLINPLTKLQDGLITHPVDDVVSPPQSPQLPETETGPPYKLVEDTAKLVDDIPKVVEDYSASAASHLDDNKENILGQSVQSTEASVAPSANNLLSSNMSVASSRSNTTAILFGTVQEDHNADDVPTFCTTDSPEKMSEAGISVASSPMYTGRISRAASTDNLSVASMKSTKGNVRDRGASVSSVGTRERGGSVASAASHSPFATTPVLHTHASSTKSSPGSAASSFSPPHQISSSSHHATSPTLIQPEFSIKSYEKSHNVVLRRQSTAGTAVSSLTVDESFSEDMGNTGGSGSRYKNPIRRASSASPKDGFSFLEREKLKVENLFASSASLTDASLQHKSNPSSPATRMGSPPFIAPTPSVTPSEATHTPVTVTPVQVPVRASVYIRAHSQSPNTSNIDDRSLSYVPFQNPNMTAMSDADPYPSVGNNEHKDDINTEFPAPPLVEKYKDGVSVVCVEHKIFHDFTNCGLSGKEWLSGVTSGVNESFGFSPVKRQSLVPFESLSYIKVLILQNNRIDSFNWSILLDMPNLVELDLSHNLISNIDESTSYILNEGGPGVATGCLHSCLEKLDISHNRLVSVTGLTALVNLKELNVSHNLIKNPVGLPMNQLERFDVSYNKIKSVVSLRMLSVYTSLFALNIEGNPLMGTLLTWKQQITSMLPNMMEINGETLPKAAKLFKSHREKNELEAKKVAAEKFAKRHGVKDRAYQILKSKQHWKSLRHNRMNDTSINDTTQGGDNVYLQRRSSYRVDVNSEYGGMNNTTISSISTELSGVSKKAKHKIVQQAKDAARSSHFMNRLHCMDVRRHHLVEEINAQATHRHMTPRAQMEVFDRLNSSVLSSSMIGHDEPQPEVPTFTSFPAPVPRGRQLHHHAPNKARAQQRQHYQQQYTAPHNYQAGFQQVNMDDFQQHRSDFQQQPQMCFDYEEQNEQQFNYDEPPQYAMDQQYEQKQHQMGGNDVPQEPQRSYCMDDGEVEAGIYVDTGHDDGYDDQHLPVLTNYGEKEQGGYETSKQIQSTVDASAFLLTNNSTETTEVARDASSFMLTNNSTETTEVAKDASAFMLANSPTETTEVAKDASAFMLANGDTSEEPAGAFTEEMASSSSNVLDQIRSTVSHTSGPAANAAVLTEFETLAVHDKGSAPVASTTSDAIAEPVSSVSALASAADWLADFEKKSSSADDERAIIPMRESEAPAATAAWLVEFEKSSTLLSKDEGNQQEPSSEALSPYASIFGDESSHVGNDVTAVSEQSVLSVGSKTVLTVTEASVEKPVEETAVVVPPALATAIDAFMKPPSKSDEPKMSPRSRLRARLLKNREKAAASAEGLATEG